MNNIMQTKALIRRGVWATAVAAVLVLGGLPGALNLSEAVNHNTISVVAGGGSWAG